ncbi:nucleoid-associated protein [Aeromonas sp. R5-3]|uniref:nucleoid-associated protein n=1 Tax=Aeromonas TaxID=642 RepID=UPI0034A4053C
MENLEVLEYSLHKVDVKSAGPVPMALDGTAEGLKTYTELVLKDLLESPRSRFFKFKDMDELVASSLVTLSKGADWKAKSNQIARKLYDVEITVQDKIKQMTNVKAGGLLQLKVKHDGCLKFVLIKIDNSDYLDEVNLSLKSGLPTSKDRLQKAAVITFNSESTVDEVIVSDSKATITEYWYLSFLVAEQLQDSETNTKNAFAAIDNLLSKEVKNVSPVDYWFLRNDIINHFRNESSLAYDDLVNKVKSHKPETEEFKAKFGSFVEKFEALPTTSPRPFDTQFDLEPSVIRARIVRKVMLDSNFELRINGEVKDLKSRISASKDEKGKFIKIYTDKGYEEFKTSEEK